MISRRRIVTAILLGALLALPAGAPAAEVPFGSNLTGAPDVARQSPDDTNNFIVAGAGALGGGAGAPADGLITRIRVKGFAPKGDLDVKFRVIRPLPDGRFLAVSTPLIGTLPGPDRNGIHTYDVPDPRAFRVQAGDLIGIFQQGNFDPVTNPDGSIMQIFTRAPGWQVGEVSIHNGFNDGTTEPALRLDDVQLLLEAVLSPDRCPGSDVPQDPCGGPAQLGKTFIAEKVSGRVLVKPQGARRFRRLTDDETLRMGTQVDTLRGRVRIVTAASADGVKQSSDFYRGRFAVTQRNAEGGLTIIKLLDRARCAAAAQAAQRRRRGGRLWGNGSGNFQTKGKHGSATKRGTIWLTEERCGATFFRVTEGSVSVRDFAKRRTVVLTAPRRYLARARR
jgi:hypothetical protein